MITLPELPFAIDALQPHISSETLEYHYGKHHKSYLAKLNGQIEGTELGNLTLEEIVARSSGGTFNCAAQVYNHNLYWQCLSPEGGGAPGGDLAGLIDRDFGSFDDFKSQFTQTALTTFGSGWAWLVMDASGALSLQSTGNASTPITGDKIPLLTCDVWEHAYYIDYRNARAKYVEAFWNLVNWEFVAKQVTRRAAE